MKKQVLSLVLVVMDQVVTIQVLRVTKKQTVKNNFEAS